MCAAAMVRIRKGINASAGQHKRAIRKAFEAAGLPVTAEVSAEPQRRIPVVSEGTESARRINDPDRIRRAALRREGCAFFGCNYPEGECAGDDLCQPRAAR
jgi:hypothetical protein